MSLISDATQAARNAPGAIQGFLALSTPNRLRRELRETMDLYERALQLSGQEGGHDDVQEATQVLARLVKKEANDLNAAVGGPLRIFAPDWRAIGSLAFVAIVFVFADALLMRSGIAESIWGWAVIAVVTVLWTVLGIILVPVVVQAVRGPRRSVMTVPRAEVGRLFGDANEPEAPSQP